MDYHKIYRSLIEKSKNRILENNTYTEKHHVIPRCLGGNDNSDNLVNLTPEEHLIAHLLLVKMFPDNVKLIYAANWMTNRVKNNKHYGWVKRQFAENESRLKTGHKRTHSSIEKQRNSLLNKYKNGFISPCKGKKITDEHKKRISESNKGKKIELKSRSSLESYILRYGDEGFNLYKEHCKKKDSSSLNYYIKKYGSMEGTKKYQEKKELISEKMSGENNPFYGKKQSSESRKKISESNKGKNKLRTKEHNIKIGLSNKGKKMEIISCPHCNKTGGSTLMKRWHFDNCKLKS
jgi:hypothetical protein